VFVSIIQVPSNELWASDSMGDKRSRTRGIFIETPFVKFEGPNSTAKGLGTLAHVTQRRLRLVLEDQQDEGQVP
jgi:hypothetical protein